MFTRFLRLLGLRIPVLMTRRQKWACKEMVTWYAHVSSTINQDLTIYIFQLIFDGEGGAVWGSGTAGDRGADKLLFGLGSEAEPYLELTKADGQRLWSA